MRGLFLCCSRKDKQPKTCTHIGIQAASFPWQTSAVWKTNLSVRGLPADLENGHKGKRSGNGRRRLSFHHFNNLARFPFAAAPPYFSDFYMDDNGGMPDNVIAFASGRGRPPRIGILPPSSPGEKTFEGSPASQTLAITPVAPPIPLSSSDAGPLYPSGSERQQSTRNSDPRFMV